VKVHIGETCHISGTRVSQHEGNVEKGKYNPALVCHSEESRQEFQFSKTEILAQGSTNTKRKVREMVELKKRKNRPAIN